jgi:hypothetical protein
MEIEFSTDNLEDLEASNFLKIQLEGARILVGKREGKRPCNYNAESLKPFTRTFHSSSQTAHSVKS